MLQIILKIIFWLSSLALLHTYAIYPLLLRILPKRKTANQFLYDSGDEMPEVSIIMAVYNEERILLEKIQSVFNSGYPVDKITFYIGSDASTDNTDIIVKDLMITFPQIVFKRFPVRIGKVQIINDLVSQCKSELLAFTDAHAVLSPNSLFSLLKHFKNEEIKVVGGSMQNSLQPSGNIVFQEWSYFQNEYRIKDAESRLWGCMVGAFGSFYAIRRKSWKPVPVNFITDDFYISLKAIEHGGKAIFEPNAVVFENVPGSMKEEFRRKSRIAAGNFQNMSSLYHILFSTHFALAFCFLSHKVLRWYGPILMIFSMISLCFLFTRNPTYSILFIIMLLSFIVPIIDFYLEKIRIHVVILRFISHFYYMNIALLAGLFRYMKGVKSNVWEPTKRD